MGGTTAVKLRHAKDQDTPYGDRQPEMVVYYWRY